MNVRSSVRRGRPRVGKQPGRETATAALLDAAEDVLADRGTEATTMAAVARRAGVAVGTLYNYFPDRGAMINALFKHRRQELLPALSAAARAAQRLPFERRLSAYIAAVLELFERRRKFLAVASAVDQTSFKVKAPKPAMMSTVTEAFVDIVIAVAPESADAHGRMMLGAMKALVLWRLERGEPFAGDADLLSETFLHGIAK
jgi:AcrR family transcriptional regulator